MQQITFILVLYDHTAPGEREARMARAVERAWGPLLSGLQLNPQVRLCLSLSGALAEYLDQSAPWILEQLGELVARGQVEMLAGSPSGAALQGIPERDALGHLAGATRFIHQRFDATARGAWLGAGGWDGALPRLLARAGMRYTFVDQGLVGTGGQRMDGKSPWFVAEREGAAVGVFPLDPRLPLMLPWALPRYCAYELKERARVGERFVTAAVAVDMLGMRHGSHRWCWGSERGWGTGFLRMLKSQASWLKTALPGQLVDTVRPGGRVYPSAGTPFFDGQGALPSAAAQRYGIVRRDLAEGFDPSLRRAGTWVVGPPWDAFLARRDEANAVHKRMLRASAAVHRLHRQLRNGGGQLPGDRRRVDLYERARGWLYSGQSGAPIHGGEAGGADRADLRHAAWRALGVAEHLALQGLDEDADLFHEIVDHDCDGVREVVITSPHYATVVRPGLGGAIGELGVWGVGNLVATMSRQEEPWHEQLAFSAALPRLVEELDETRPADGASPEPVDEDELLQDEITDESGSFTVHTESVPQVSLPEPPPLPVPLGGLHELLDSDRHRRLLFQERFFGPELSLDNLRRDQSPEQGDFLDRPYALMSAERVGNEVQVALAREGTVQQGGLPRLLRIHKRYVFRRDSPVIDLSYEVSNRYREPIHTRFAVEMNLGLDGQAAGRFVQSGDRRAFLDRDAILEQATDIAVVLRDLQLRIQLWSAEPGTLYCYRVQSVVRSCEGYEPALQGTCLVLAWDLHLWGEERRRFDLFFNTEKA